MKGRRPKRNVGVQEANEQKAWEREEWVFIWGSRLMQDTQGIMRIQTNVAEPLGEEGKVEHL